VKRIFTWQTAQSKAVPATSGVALQIMATFLAQEDVIIIGAAIHAHHQGTAIIGNDGIAAMGVELTPQAAFMKEGGILYAIASQIWNTTPAAVQINDQAVTIMFPEGYGIPVKEEGIINVLVEHMNSTAAIVGFVADVTLYYVKGVKVTK